ncbi:MAG: response regulator [Bacteroidales bacterium]|nr:response regulator [Bacteroidales bacterium]
MKVTCKDRKLYRFEMNISKDLFRYVLCLLAMAMATAGASAYNIRRISSDDGLSSSAVLSMAQDASGFLWIGTLDGVNITDGSVCTPFSVMYPGLSLSGNLIENIIAGSDGCMWVLTNHGLDRVDPAKHTVTSYPRFKGQERLATDRFGNLYVLATDNVIYTIPAGEGSEPVALLAGEVKHPDVRSMTVTGDYLTLLGDRGQERFTIGYDVAGKPSGLGSRSLLTGRPVKTGRADADGAVVVTRDNMLYKIDRAGDLTPVLDLGAEIAWRGEPSDILRLAPDDIFVSFTANGVLRIKKGADGKYTAEDIGVKSGVFCLDKSQTQPVVWVGSDCHGLFTCYDSPFTVRSTGLTQFDDLSDNPVRALYLDDDHTLWLGTKGGGLLQVPDFKPGTDLKRASATRFTSAKTPLSNNSVFAFASSPQPLLWIATDEGVDYYSYTDKRIHNAGNAPEMRFIHDIYQSDDSTLWLATVGKGVVKCRISGSKHFPELTVDKVYANDGGDITSNFFFSLTPSADGRLLFANRGLGVFAVEGDSLRSQVTLKGLYDSNAVKDVFTVVDEDSVMWLGTGHGLMRVGPDSERLFFGLENGFKNNTIHDILKDKGGNLWVSTNNGLYCFDPRTESTRVFGRNDGINVTEFSDGAAFNADSILIFGGVDGFVTVQKAGTFCTPDSLYTPPLALLRMSIGGENVDMLDYIDMSSGNTTLTLRPEQRQFTLTFATPDFMTPADCYYEYSLDGREWINNGSSGSISFNEMGYGKYHLAVKAVNRITNDEGAAYLLTVNILAPWYLSGVAKTLYLVCLLLAILGVAGVYMRRQRRKRAEELAAIEHQHREEVYEEKLRFFTNITHEFCTPLTLIYGPCERISHYPGSDAYIKKYIGLIRTNVERLNTLIQELIDFRRIETGHKELKIRPVNVTELCEETAAAFTELAERNEIDFKMEIARDVIWNTDFSALRKVLNNLISNAFKYTPQGGRIEVSLKHDEADKLRLEVYNTGKGIRDEDRDSIFNRYSVLDNVEENAVKGLSARNGLGLAICNSIVKLLGGDITIESERGKFACFVVTLPQLEADHVSEPAANSDTSSASATLPASSATVSPSASPLQLTGGKDAPPTLLVIDDNREILSLLTDSLSDYNVIAAESAAEGLEQIKRSHPDLIITDIMMPGTDGLTFARQIKSNRHLMHIPLVILSARASTEEKVEGIESGADAFIGKPFSVSYLRAIVARLLSSRETLREYYNSSASSFEYADGNLLDKEDKDFLDRVAEYIDEHLRDENLSPEILASIMQISSRNLYRKFKELNQPTPNEFIKNRRMMHATKMLLTTSRTVQEIVFAVGFTNRTHFYKEFEKRYGMTPKDYRIAHKVSDDSL